MTFLFVSEGIWLRQSLSRAMETWYIKSLCVLGLVKCTLYTYAKYCGMMNAGSFESKEICRVHPYISSMLFVHFMNNILKSFKFIEPLFCRRHAAEHLLVFYKYRFVFCNWASSSLSCTLPPHPNIWSSDLPNTSYDIITIDLL